MLLRLFWQTARRYVFLMLPNLNFITRNTLMSFDLTPWGLVNCYTAEAF